VFGFCREFVVSSSGDTKLISDARLAPIMIARLYCLVPHIRTEIALHFSVISAPITSLRPFLRTFHLNYTVDSKGASKYGTRSGDHNRPRDSYYRLDPISDSRKVIASQQQREQWESGATARASRPQGQDMGAELAHGSIGRAVSQDDLLPEHSKSLSITPMPRERIAIQKTVDWTIQYEGSGSP
jgi:hypothetical protein